MTSSIEDDGNVRHLSTLAPDVILDELGPEEFEQRVTRTPETIERFIRDRAADNAVRAARPWGTRTHEDTLATGREAAERERVATHPRIATIGEYATYDEAPRHRPRLPLAAAAAIVALVLAGLWMAFGNFDRGDTLSTSRHYAAGATVPRTVTLEDGTLVVLASGTAVDTNFTPQERNVALPEGEAKFTVTHNQNRPFVVRAPYGMVRVLGTVFKVHVGHERMDVHVEEGRVTFLSAVGDAVGEPFGAGQSAVLYATGRIEVIAGAVASSAVPPAAKRSALPFTDVPLPRVARLFNQKSGRHLFEVRGSACTFRVNSSLDPSRPEELLSDLADERARFVVEKVGDVNVIRARNDASDAVCKDDSH